MLLYNLLLILILIAYIPHLTLRGKWHKGLWIQLGKWPNAYATNLKHSHNIWIHAVSVGEVLAIEGVVKGLLAQYPNHQIVLSTVTRTGNELAVSKFKDSVKIIYAPFDFSWVVKKFIQHIKPAVYVAAETELWPNLYRFLDENNIPIIQINGRISDGSFKGYSKVKLFIAKTLRRVKCFCMQSSLDQERICALGANADTVKTIGNLKFDSDSEISVLARSDYGYTDEDIVWIAGSTHPGEEEIVLNIYSELAKLYPNLKLILAPRHIERVDEVVKLIKEKNIIFYKHSERVGKSENVVLVDTIGHLRKLYSLADIVFVGKTLIGVGGQNILEPALFAKPIIVGPHMENFKGIMDLFKAKEAVIIVNDETALTEAVVDLMKDVKKRVLYGDRALSIMQENRGATNKAIEVIGEYI